MPLRAKVLITVVLSGAVAAFATAAHTSERPWWTFAICLAAALLSSGLKVPRLSGSGSMSLNYTFVFLSIVQLSPLQAFLIAALSTAVQCRLKQRSFIAVVQVLFNIANSVCSTAAAYACYSLLLTHGVALAPALAFAAAAYFLCNTLPVAFAIGWSSSGDPLEIWRAEFTWFLPFYLVGAVLAAAGDLALARFGWATAALLIPVIYTVYRSYVGQVNRLDERRKHLEETEALHLRTIEGLAMAVEAKDQNTHDHLFRVRDYVAKVATLMNLDDMQKKALQTAAFLHDIGKLAVPEHIINKPGKLTTDEFEKMKIHPVVGADILERVRFPYPVVPIVRSHHERWDGQGYPDGLQGEDIPVGARILSVVDCFDALASDRPYRRALPLPKAMDIVKSMAGSQFDPQIVAILDQCYAEFEKIYEEPGTFQALNLEMEVQRGIAPGAGFETEHAQEGNTPAAKTTQDVYLDAICAAGEAAQAMFELSQHAGSSLSVEDTVALMASRLHALVPFDCCALYLKQTEAVAARYIDAEFRQLFTRTPIPLGDGLSGWVAQSGLPILNGNAHVEPTYIRANAGETRLELASAVAIPLLDLQGSTFGVLTLYARDADRFSKGHLRVLRTAEPKFSLALGNALSNERSGNGAHAGAVSHLPNSSGLLRALAEEVSRSEQRQGHCALIVCGLQSPSTAHERHSEAAASSLQRCFVDQLQQRCRHQDTVARLGAAEFAVLMPDLQEAFTPERLLWISEAIATASKQACVLPNATVSYGAAFYPHDGETPEDLIAAANREMFRHKQQQIKSVVVSAAMPLKPVLVA